MSHHGFPSKTVNLVTSREEVHSIKIPPSTCTHQVVVSDEEYAQLLQMRQLTRCYYQLQLMSRHLVLLPMLICLLGIPFGHHGFSTRALQIK